MYQPPTQEYNKIKTYCNIFCKKVKYRYNIDIIQYDLYLFLLNMMKNQDLRKQIEPYFEDDTLLLEQENMGDLDMMIAMIVKSKYEKWNPRDSFNYIVQHKKELVDILLSSDKYKPNVKHILNYNFETLKLFLYIANEIDIPVEQIIASLSDDRLGLYIWENWKFSKSLFVRLVHAFWKNDLRQYVCVEETKTTSRLRIVHEWDITETNFFANKLTNIIRLCWFEQEDVFILLEDELWKAATIKEKVFIIESFADFLESKKQLSHYYAIPLKKFFETTENNNDNNKIILKINNLIEWIYFHDLVPLHKKPQEKIDTHRISYFLEKIYINKADWEMFYNFITKNTTSVHVKLLINNVSNYLSIFESVFLEIEQRTENDILEYIHNLSFNDKIYDHIKLWYIQNIRENEVFKDKTTIHNTLKLIKIYQRLNIQIEDNKITNKTIMKDFRKNITTFSPSELENFYQIFVYTISQDIVHLFIQADALHQTKEEKFAFYDTIILFWLDKHITKLLFLSYIEKKTIQDIKDIYTEAQNKDKNEIRHYLYNNYFYNKDSSNKLLFHCIWKFITEDMTNTEKIYNTIPILQTFIDNHPEEKEHITKLWYQISKRSIEEQNAFCDTIILLNKNNDLLITFVNLCKKTSNHYKRKEIVNFQKNIEIIYHLSWWNSRRIKDIFMDSTATWTFQNIDLEKILEDITTLLHISPNIIPSIIKNDILIKFIGKIIKNNDDLQNRKLGILLESHITWTIKNTRSHITEQDFWDTKDTKDSESKKMQDFWDFDIAWIHIESREKLQNEQKITKHIHWITHKEQWFNIKTAFDELFDPDIYSDNQKKFIKFLYHRSPKQSILQNLQNTYKEDEAFQSLQFIRQHVAAIDTCINMISENENDLQIYDRAIAKAQEVYKNIYHSLLQNNNEQLAIRCEEYSSHFWLTIHDGDISSEEKIRESMNLETTITYNIVKILTHMRGCIWLQNNPVSNLAYLLPNRFFIFSQDQETQKWVSDQIIILLSSEALWPLYVMDVLYGTRNLSTITSHIQVLYQHILSHKETINIPIFIPSNVIWSSGIKTPTLFSHLEQLFPNATIKLTSIDDIDTTRSWYKEFSTTSGWILLSFD